MRYFVTGHEMLLYLSGDREEHKEECCFELPDFESKEEAVAAAREFIKEHKNAVNDQKHGIGSVTYWTAEVTRCIEDEDFGWSFRLSFATRPGYDGDHEDISDGDSYELGEYENSEEALAAAEAFISTHGNEVNDEEDGIGSVIYWTVEVERRVEYKENEWLPCDESGRIDDGYGNEPNATVAYLSSLEGSREERAFELAKNEYLAWLEHKEDRYTTVYGYMD